MCADHYPPSDRDAGHRARTRDTTDAAGRLCAVHARSALFDVYGDHLRTRGRPGAGRRAGAAPGAGRHRRARRCARRSRGWSPRAGSRRCCSTAAAATARRRGRSAGSTRPPRGSTAASSPRGTAPGSWSLVDAPTQRAARDRLRADLGFVGYAELAPDVWISPHERAELDVGARGRAAPGRAPPGPPTSTPPPAAAWDLDALRTAYDAWLGHGAPRSCVAHTDGHHDADEAAFAARFHLVHEWRKFLFADPGLPPELLPADWPGPAAAELLRRRGRPAAHGAPSASSPAAWAADTPAAARIGQTAAHDRLPRAPRRDRRRRHDHPQPARRDEQPRRRDQGGAARGGALGGRRPGRALRRADRRPAAAFCVGQDLKEHIEILRSESSESLFRTVDEHYNPIVSTLATMAKPVVAAVNGVAAGAGASLAFACDLRILGRHRRLQPRLRQRGAVVRHRRQLPPAAAGRPGEGDRAALLPAHGAGRGVAGARPRHPGGAGRRARRHRGASWPPGWPPARRSRWARCASRSPTPPATRSRSRWRSRAR